MTDNGLNDSIEPKADAPHDATHDAASAPPPQLPRGALGAWWLQGIRTALLMRADWSGLRATPAITACLFLVPFVLGVGVGRLLITGPASFYWPTLLSSHWMGVVLLA